MKKHYLILGIYLFLGFSVKTWAHESSCTIAHQNMSCSITLSDKNQNLNLNVILHERMPALLNKVHEKKLIDLPLWITGSYTKENGEKVALFFTHHARIYLKEGKVYDVKVNIEKIEGDLKKSKRTSLLRKLNNSKELTKNIRAHFDENLSPVVLEQLSFFNATTEVIDITPLLKQMSVGKKLSKKLPGNESNAILHEASLELQQSMMTVNTHFQLDMKNKTCVLRYCFHPWRINTHIDLEATINEDCNVYDLSLNKWGTHTKGLAWIISPLLNFAYEIFHGYASNYIAKKLEDYLKANPLLDGKCKV